MISIFIGRDLNSSTQPIIIEIGDEQVEKHKLIFIRN